MHTFFLWERASRDTIDFKTTYVDMAGDLVAGLLLSQIVYWHLPKRNGEPKLTVERDGKTWLAKGHADWYAECRITARQAKRALDVLVEKQLVETALFKFAGAPMTHIRIVPETFLTVWQQTTEPNGTDGEVGFIPNVQIHSDETCQSSSETTSENTTVRRDASASQAHSAPEPVAALVSVEENRAASVRTLARQHFEEQTHLKMPERGAKAALGKLWWNPIGEICALAGGDLEGVKHLIDRTLQRMDGLTISDPNSIIKTARAVAAEKEGQRPPRRGPDKTPSTSWQRMG
jgi:hypothetical protein